MKQSKACKQNQTNNKHSSSPKAMSKETIGDMQTETNKTSPSSKKNQYKRTIEDTQT